MTAIYICCREYAATCMAGVKIVLCRTILKGPGETSEMFALMRAAVKINCLHVHYNGTYSPDINNDDNYIHV